MRTRLVAPRALNRLGRSGLRWLVVVVWTIALGLAALVIAGMPDSEDDSLPSGPVIETPMSVTTLRVAAFGTTELPRRKPFVEHDVADLRFPYAARIDRLTVKLPDGFTSVAYDLWPRSWNGRALIFHNGHGQDVAASPHVLRWFLARGWRVTTMAMPLAGENADPGFRPGDSLHEPLAEIDRPLGMFLLPVVAVVNHTGAKAMVGLSGGGWTTIATAAIDRRILASYSVAGSIPWRYRCPPSGCFPADLEQRMIPNYMRLYELGSQAPRRQMALYNAADPCCFGGRHSHRWAGHVRGNFTAVTDPKSRRHDVTAFHLRVITKDLAVLEERSSAWA